MSDMISAEPRKSTVAEIHSWPLVALEPIRNLFPYPRNRKIELDAMCRALDRLCAGEKSGMKMGAEDAMDFLSCSVYAASQELANREKKYTPHFSTWLNQSRYLVRTEPLPENLDDAISILACYPTVTQVDLKTHMGVLRVIDNNIQMLAATHGTAAASYIRTRTFRFAECVRRWPEEEMKFIPGVEKFFRERRYEQHERFWTRNQNNGYQSERAQLLRIL